MADFHGSGGQRINEGSGQAEARVSWVRNVGRKRLAAACASQRNHENDFIDIRSQESKPMKLLRNHARQLVQTMLVFGFTSVMGVTPLFAQATLAYLVANNGTLTIGDKTFSNFGWQASLADASELNTDAAGLIVTPQMLDGIYYLDFSGGIVVDNLLGTSTLLGDLKLTYTVTASPGWIINMIDQNYTVNALQNSGQIIIGETVKDAQAIIVGNSTLTLNPLDLSDPLAETGDNLNINPGEQKLFVMKDITIAAYANQLVGMSDIQQSFHQVPEPSAMLLGSLGGGWLLFLRSRRQARRD